MREKTSIRPARTLIALGLAIPLLAACNSVTTGGGSGDTGTGKVAGTTASERPAHRPENTALSGRVPLPEMEERNRLFKEGNDARKAGNFKLSAERFGELARRVPGNAGYWTVLGHSLIELKRLDEAREALEKGATLASQGGHRKLEAFASKHLSRTLMLQKKYARAEAVNERAIGLYRQHDDFRNIAVMHGLSGIIKHKQQNHAGAINAHRNALKLFRQLNDRRAIARELRQIGLLEHLYFSKRNQAVPPMEEAMKLFRAMGDRDGVASVQRVLGLAYSARGEHQLGIKTMNSAFIYYDGVQTRHAQIRAAETLGNMATIYRTIKDFDTSLSMQRRALNMEMRLGLRGTMGSNYANIAAVLKDKGDLAGACENWRLAEKQYVTAKATPLIDRMRRMQKQNGCARELST